MEVNIKVYRGLNEELLYLIFSLETAIFKEPYSKEKIERECSVKHQLLALVAFSKGKAVGYKVGYEMTSRIFYSWMGGVLPEYRHNGVARKLMSKQHSLVQEMGYKVVRTYTENKYRDMLLLNIRFGFDVQGVMNDSANPKTIIILDKRL